VDPLPPLELLEATHVFPGKYVFKAIGPNSDEFIETVIGIVRSELGHEFDPPYQLNRSTHGRHVSVTIEPFVDTPQQILAIYERLRHVEGLAMML
jgi:putative lipoic acid-binding regulatory protein